MNKKTYSFGRDGATSEKGSLSFRKGYGAHLERRASFEVSKALRGTVGAKGQFSSGRVSKDSCFEGEKVRKKRDVAADLALAAGCAVLLLFLLLGSFGKNTEPLEYSNYTNVEYYGAVPVFSQIIYPDGRIERSGSEPFVTRVSQEDCGGGNKNYANAENTFADSEEPWNFWQYLCDSLAELFGITNAE